MRFPEYFVQQVAQATDIVELISQYVALKRRGREFVGLCPFHDDTSPSLTVAPAKQLFKCFACGAGGGVFQFVMLYEKLPFIEAIRTLAERAHVPLPKQTPNQPPEKPGLSKNDLLAVTAFAAGFYRDQLHSPAGRNALDYARGRGLTDESIERFGVGWAPPAWDGLCRAAASKGITESQLVAAGLVARRESGGCYDRFRNRLMFAIADPAGRVVAFGGRALDEADHAKYLNSPESVLFDKSGLLYGLNWAREGIVASGQAVVVEGYLDALLPLQAGISNVVATLGTALTDRHVRLLGRYAREGVLVFDADLAGANAAQRALEIFLAQRLHVRVATIPAGKDPCDYCLAEGAGAFSALVDAAPDALQYVWRRRQAQFEAAEGQPAERHRIVEDFLRLVVESAAYGAIDEVRRGQLAQHIGHMLNVDARDLQQQMRRLSRRVRRDGPAAEGQGQAVETGHLAERQVLEVLLNRPDLFGTVAGRLEPGDFRSRSLQAIADRVWALGRADRLALEELLAGEPDTGRASLMADLATTGERRGNFGATLTGALAHFLYRRQQREIQELKASEMGDDQLRQIEEYLRCPDVRKRPRIT